MKNKKILAIIMLVIIIATLVVPMFSLNTFALADDSVVGTWLFNSQIPINSVSISVPSGDITGTFYSSQSYYVHQNLVEKTLDSIFVSGDISDSYSLTISNDDESPVISTRYSVFSNKWVAETWYGDYGTTYDPTVEADIIKLRTISITYLADGHEDFIAWLKANAVKQGVQCVTNEINLNCTTWSFNEWYARGMVYGYDIDFDLNEYTDYNHLYIGFEWIYDFDIGAPVLSQCDDSIAISKGNNDITVTVKNDVPINIVFKSDVQNNLSSSYLITWFMINLDTNYALTNSVANTLVPWNTFINDYVQEYRPFWYNNNLDDSYTYDMTVQFGLGRQAGYIDGEQWGQEIGYNKGYDDGYGVGYDEGINANDSQQFANNLLGATLNAPLEALNNFVLIELGEVDITLGYVLGAVIGLSLLLAFLKMFAGG